MTILSPRLTARGEKTRRNRRERKSLLAALRGQNGAIDLASIMVGVLVIGIIGGVIAATVFAVIPWAQDQAAKGNLAAVATAEGVYRAQGAGFAAIAQLQQAKDLQASANTDAHVSWDAGCFVATAVSATGRQFWRESVSPTVHEFTAGTIPPSKCNTIDRTLVEVASPVTSTRRFSAPGPVPALLSNGTPSADLVLMFHHPDAMTTYFLGIQGYSSGIFDVHSGNLVAGVTYSAVVVSVNNATGVQTAISNVLQVTG